MKEETNDLVTNEDIEYALERVDEIAKELGIPESEVEWMIRENLIF